jgi:nitroimidazol reductase NimA-like FMN-containing flavoprotein (pyridoxamine 5'-phosphate oxidase superfamily)
MPPEAIADPLAGAALRVGHRELLDTFGEFVHEMEAGGPGRAAESAAGAVAFLRHGVLPFGRREEALYTPGGPVAEDAAFEHAFLAAEADALAREAAALAEGHVGALALVRRRALRIQAVLELHVAKTEDREDVFAAVAAPAPVAVADAGEKRSHSPHHHRDMDAAEVAAFLRGRTWGLLATVGDGMPYAVPVGYAYDGATIYFASGAGKKRRNLEETGIACLTVPDVTDGTHWRCVVAAGRVTRLSGPLARVRALDLIRRKRGGSLPPPRRLAKLLAAAVFRLDATELSGRAVG